MSSGRARLGSLPSRYARMALTASPSVERSFRIRAAGDSAARPASSAPARVGGGCQAELRVGALVHAARGAVAGFIDCGTHVGPPFEFMFESRDAARVSVLLGGDAEYPLEGAQQAVRPLTEPLGEGAQGRCIGGFERATRLAHERD